MSTFALALRIKSCCRDRFFQHSALAVGRHLKFTRMSSVFLPVSETKHLAPGSKCPENTRGLMRLYSMKFCPYAQRTRLVLAAKRIQNEVVNINLVTKPDWYFVKNPLGKVPCLEIDGKIIYESLITADYLDESYQGAYLLNNPDPYLKAQDRIYIELFSKVNGNLYKLYRATLEDESSWSTPMTGLHEGLQLFEDELSRRKSKFYGGEKPGMLDYMIWPWMERLPSLPILSNNLLKVRWEEFPALSSWFDAMKEDDAVKESLISPEIHARFIKSFLAGNPDYDMLNN